MTTPDHLPNNLGDCSRCPQLSGAKETLDKMISGLPTNMLNNMDEIREQLIATALANGDITPFELDEVQKEIDEMMPQVNIALAGVLNSIEETVESALSDPHGKATERTVGCPGPLTMRAQDKLGKTVLVSVCSSPMQTDEEKTALCRLKRS